MKEISDDDGSDLVLKVSSFKKQVGLKSCKVSSSEDYDLLNLKP